MFCSKCGNQMPNNSTFCSRCGNQSAANSNSNYPNTPPVGQSQYIPPQNQIPYNPQQYGQSSYNQPLKYDGSCIAAFICAIIGFWVGALIFGTLGIIIGAVGVGKFDEYTQKGKWMGIVGIVLGIIDVIAGLFIIGNLF